MKYQKRYKPKTKFEKFLKVYFIIGILVIVLTGVYAGVKSMQRKKEAASETIIHTVAVPKISLKKTEWAGKKRFVDCEFEPIKDAKRYYIAMSLTEIIQITQKYQANLIIQKTLCFVSNKADGKPDIPNMSVSEPSYPEIKDIQIGVKYYQLKQMKKWQQIIKRTLIRSQQDLF
ncbi:hypothetical protein [Anaerobutyricum hallii]|uniref:Uncharacterized protein n=1 Tax=Anaerobutyricum hallii TaxID=39488 RepID=A0A374NBH5_9FIRM|nr:hypothetical protein [Anaerobutyricum hallii]RGI81240.1 hypothetical protein DXD91_12925 [Anaerobutyricum hallii]